MSHDTRRTAPRQVGWASRHRNLLAILVGVVAVALAIAWILVQT